eukprot:UN14874
MWGNKEVSAFMPHTRFKILRAERDRRDIKIETGVVEFWKIEDHSEISTFISRMVIT